MMGGRERLSEVGTTGGKGKEKMEDGKMGEGAKVRGGHVG
jgi:hypothetical protein